MLADKFIRDNTNPGAVINNDIQALKAYKAQKEKFRELEKLKTEVDDIKRMLIDIHQLLKERVKS